MYTFHKTKAISFYIETHFSKGKGKEQKLIEKIILKKVKNYFKKRN